jgi:hypothetical protein
VAVSAIAINAAGTIRLAGLVTTSGAVVVGTTYYVSATAGALASSAPALSRQVGVAMTTSSLLLAATTAVVGALPNPITQDLLFTDNTYDIGKSGATRPRDGFFSRNAVVGGTLGVSGISTFTADLVATTASMSFQDAEGVVLGTGSDATIKYDGTDVSLDTQAVGSGLLIVTGSSAISGVEIDNTATDGDPTLAFTLSGTSLFTMGVDDGDSDKFKIGTTAIGTSTALTIDGSQNITAGADLTVTGDLVVTGVGPHAIGGASYGPVGTIFGGSFTSSGASTYAAGILTNQGVTGASGDTASIVGSRFASAITTQTATETIAYIAQVDVQEPTIDDNLTGDITVAASLYVKNAPTEGETNAALYVAAGTTYLGGNVGIGVSPDYVLDVDTANSYAQFRSTNGDCLRITENAANTSPAQIELKKSRGSYASPGDIVNGDMFGQIHASGWSGSEYWGTAHIDFRCEGTVTSGQRPGSDLAFYTNVSNAAPAVRLLVADTGLVHVYGTFTAGTKTFRIPHPLPELNDTNYLIHGCLEGPRLDLIYRSTVTLVAGSATVDLDEASGMTAGTWALLCRDAQVFTTNETGWFHVRGTVSGSTLTIECEEGTCTDTVSWMVVAERQDDEIKAQSSTDEDGHLIIEPLQVEEVPDPEE